MVLGGEPNDSRCAHPEPAESSPSSKQAGRSAAGKEPAVPANGAEHLALVSVTATTAAGAAVAVASAALGVASRRPAAGTAPGLVHKAPGRIEFLLACGKDERLAAVAAGQGLVCVAHADSSRKLLVGFRVSASRAWTACGSRATIGAG